MTKHARNQVARFAFLQSNRFWAIIIGAVSVYLQAKGIIGDPEMLLIATITTSFTVVRTVDRMSEVPPIDKTI